MGGKYRAAAKHRPPRHDLIVEPFADSSPDDILSLPLNWDVPCVSDLDIPLGARHLIGWWLNRGSCRPRQAPSAWMRSGIRPGCFWGEAVRDRIAHQVPLIKHWRIVQGDYSLAPDVPATWFVDPPYQQAGRHYRFGSDAIDFLQLARWCRSREGQVVVCENAGADWLPFEEFGNVKAMHGGARAGISREVVWEGAS
jgi:hypothetical protein